MTLQLFLLSLVCLSSPSMSITKAPSFTGQSKQLDDGGWLPDDSGEEEPGTATGTATYTPPEPRDTVTTPEAGDVWEHGRGHYSVEWTDLEGNLVKIFLYKDGSRVAELSGWTDDEGYYSLEEDVSPSFGSGTGYQIMVEDNLGNQIWSAVFDVLAHVRVSEPGYRTEWATGQRDVHIEWQGAPGSTAKLELLQNGDFVAGITEGWITNRGSYDLPYPVAEDWGSGEGYQVRVTDNIGNSATSPEFPIHGILVTQPTAETVWSDINPTLDIEWEGGTRVVRISLYHDGQQLETLSDWVDNCGIFRTSGFMEYNLSPGSGYGIIIQDDQGNTGRSEGFISEYSDNTHLGALTGITPAVDQSILNQDDFETEADYDYWRFNLRRGYIYRFQSDSEIELALESDGKMLETGRGSIDYHCEESGEYYLRVSATAPGTYTYELSCRNPPLPFYDVEFLEMGIFMAEHPSNNISGIYYYSTPRLTLHPYGWPIGFGIQPLSMAACYYCPRVHTEADILLNNFMEVMGGVEYRWSIETSGIFDPEDDDLSENPRVIEATEDGIAYYLRMRVFVVDAQYTYYNDINWYGFGLSISRDIFSKVGII